MKYFGTFILLLLCTVLVTELLFYNNTDINKEKIYALYVYNAPGNKNTKKQARLRNHMDRSFMVVFKKKVEQQARAFPGFFFLESVSNKKKIALTFDDGPHPVITPRVLKVLARHNVKATFFMYGKSITAFPYLVRKVAQYGHSIGIHSYNHTNITYIRASQVYKTEIQRVQTMLKKLTGKKTYIFRPPFGTITDYQAKYFSRKGIKIINWSVDSFDWRYGHDNATSIARTVITYAHPGAIVLMHDACRRECQVDKGVDVIIARLKKQGYTFCTVEDLLGLK